MRDGCDETYWRQPISRWLLAASAARRQNRVIDMTAIVQLSDTASGGASSNDGFASSVRSCKPTRAELALLIGRSEKSIYEDWPGLVSNAGGSSGRLLQDVIIQSAQRYFLELTINGWLSELHALRPSSEERLLALITVAARFGSVYPGIVLWANLPLGPDDPVLRRAVDACELESRAVASKIELYKQTISMLNTAMVRGATRSAGVVAIRNSFLAEIEMLDLVGSDIGERVRELQRSLAALINDHGGHLAAESAGLELDLRMALLFLQNTRNSTVVSNH